MDSQTLEKKYNQLVSDLDFERLELELTKPNLFEILNMVNAEIRHSNFLAWLLDPKGNHNLGTTFLKRVLRDIVIDEKINDLSIIQVEELDLPNADVRREWKNIDILIVLPTLIICIENKIYAREGKDQLVRYKNIVEKEFPKEKYKHVFVFLDPFGVEAKNEKDTYVNYSYESILSNLERVLEVIDHQAYLKTTSYINEYVVMIKRNIMNNDKANDLAKRLYRNHKQILDFIYENRPDESDQFKEMFRERVKNEGWILGSDSPKILRFYTPLLKDLIPIDVGNDGWEKKESFLFEISFRSAKRVRFQCCIGPGNDIYRETLSDILLSLPFTEEDTNRKVWLVHFYETFGFNQDKLIELEETEQINVVEEIWEKIKASTLKLEEGILGQKERLQAVISSFSGD